MSGMHAHACGAGARLARRRLEAANLALWVGADDVVNGVDSRFGLTQHLKREGGGRPRVVASATAAITAQPKVQDYGKGSSELAFLERVLRLGGRQQLLAPRVECRTQIGPVRRALGGGRRDLGFVWATCRRLKQRRDEFWCIVAESRRGLARTGNGGWDIECS
jgi:hypothetical protein